MEGVDRRKIASDRFHFTLQASKQSLFSFVIHNALERMASGPSKANRSHKIFDKTSWVFNSYHVHVTVSIIFFTNLSQSLDFLQG